MIATSLQSTIAEKNNIGKLRNVPVLPKSKKYGKKSSKEMKFSTVHLHPHHSQSSHLPFIKSQYLQVSYVELSLS